MVVARASGTDLASSLKQNTFLTLEVRPAGGPASVRDGGTEGAPGRGDTGGARDLGGGSPPLRTVTQGSGGPGGGLEGPNGAPGIDALDR